MLRTIQIFTLSLLLLFFSISSKAQFIQGIINSYTAVDSVKICEKKLQVATTAGFNVGDKVLLIQMQGATIINLNLAVYGTITAYNDCGNYEFNTITAIVGNFIYLKYYLTRTYNVADKVQLVSVPVYTNATVWLDVFGQPWNGSSGGVIAMEVTNTLTLTANIDADTIGFRGGLVNANTLAYSAANCGFTNYFTSAATANGAQKGEGIAAYTLNQEYARGAQANGGGGGNQINSGGAGGGNYGIGGNGGNQMSACPGTVQGGQGGKALTYSNAANQIFMGGGGGGGHQDNSIQATNGRPGGGIIIIKAGTIDGAGFKIRANGADQTIQAGYDGGGGGGGGGTILLDCANYISNVDVNVKGGDGSTVANANINCHGPGGGGGGGLIWYSGAIISPFINPNLAGGINGVFLSAGSPCNNSAAGAQVGAVGGTMNGLILPVDNITSQVFAGNDTATCAGKPITLKATGGTTYTWTPAAAMTNANTATPTVSNPTVTAFYTVSSPNSFGCIDKDSVKVSIGFSGNAIVSGDVTLCNGNTVALSAGGGDTYSWFPSTGLNVTNVSSVIATTNTTTTYGVAVSNAGSGCGADTGYIKVTISTNPTVDAGPDIYLPHGSTAPINATATNTSGITTYAWYPPTNLSNAFILNPTTTTPNDITYHIIVSNGPGCDAEDSMHVIMIDGELYIPNAFSPDGDGRNDLFRIRNVGWNGAFNMQLFDRWGNKVFETADPTQGWDGKYNGQDLPIDAYAYLITYQIGSDKTNHYKKGDVTLMRK